jgi:F420-0:gamma-glutamyl ligase-like protein
MAKTKSPTITVEGITYLRVPIRTHVITASDNIIEVIAKFSEGVRQPGDIIFVSEKVVAVTQGRAIPTSEIKVGLLATMLWRFVRKVPYGIGLRSPHTMQCAINECGSLRILAASMAGAAGKLIGRRGDFYRVAGMQAATIDAAGTSPLQPDCVILGPKDPNAVARAISERTNLPAAVVDVNDIGGSWVLGSSGIQNPKLIEDILKDNPLGQKDEQTPFGLIRKAQ